MIVALYDPYISIAARCMSSLCYKLEHKVLKQTDLGLVANIMGGNQGKLTAEQQQKGARRCHLLRNIFSGVSAAGFIAIALKSTRYALRAVTIQALFTSAVLVPIACSLLRERGNVFKVIDRDFADLANITGMIATFAAVIFSNLRLFIKGGVCIMTHVYTMSIDDKIDIKPLQK